MYTIRTRTKMFAVHTGRLLAGVACALLASGAAAQTVKPNVTVVNTAANPVPVTGTVTGQVTGSVSASQTGAWNVGITGTPTVQVSGSVLTHSEERPADTAAQFAVQHCDNSGYTVPAGNRLVIEFVSAFDFPDGSSNPEVGFALELKTSLNGASRTQLIPMAKQKLDNGTTIYAIHTYAGPMVAYADAGTEVCYDTAFVINGPHGLTNVYATGYLVAQP